MKLPKTRRHQSGFLPQFATGTFLEAFVDSDETTRQSPATGIRLIATLHEQNLQPIFAMPQDDDIGRHRRVWILVRVHAYLA